MPLMSRLRCACLLVRQARPSTEFEDRWRVEAVSIIGVSASAIRALATVARYGVLHRRRYGGILFETHHAYWTTEMAEITARKSDWLYKAFRKTG
jgi:hypothetical protein